MAKHLNQNMQHLHILFIYYRIGEMTVIYRHQKKVLNILNIISQKIKTQE